MDGGAEMRGQRCVWADAGSCGRMPANAGGRHPSGVLLNLKREEKGGVDDFHVSLESLSPRYLQIPARFFSQGASMLVSFG